MSHYSAAVYYQDLHEHEKDAHEQTKAALKRACYLAEHLHEMIDRETWRATGADDGQGHYEGDYHAEQTLVEIRELAGRGEQT